jgi:hypothetical protein
MQAYELRPGTLAYFDSIRGLLPVKVVSAWTEPRPLGPDGATVYVAVAKVKITSGRCPAYPRGHEITITAAGMGYPSALIARPAVRHRKYGARILPHTWTYAE